MVIKGKDEIINNKSKNINSIDDDNGLENSTNDESKQIDEYNEQELNEYKDYDRVLEKIQYRLLRYVEHNSVPICEYMTKKSIHNFIHK